MPAGADVFRRYGRESLEPCGEARRPSHRRALADLLACRTETLGGPWSPGDDWGREPSVDHACRHRRCPTCHAHDTDAWRAERRPARLPVSALPVVLTGPQARRARVRRPQQARYDSWLRAAAPARITLAADPHAGGGRMGVRCVLHTWTRALVYQPHVHGLVPAGGVSRDRTQGQPARQTSLVPVRALSTLCRGLCRALGRQACPAVRSPEAVGTTAWVV